MSYATRTDMESRFGIDELIQLTDRDGTGSFNAEVFAQAQLDGDAEIDSYIQGSYALPLSPVPTVITRIACDLYRFYLYGTTVTDFVQKRYDAALKFLQCVNKGDVILNPDSSGAPRPVTAVHVIAPDRVFSREKLRDY